MREILFRGKRLDNGEWVEGAFVKKLDPLIGTPSYFIVGQGTSMGMLDSLCTWHLIDIKTIGQYTGLKEKNGKRIFEGDIIKENDVIHNGELQYEGLFFEVVYANGCWFAIRNNRRGERKAMFLGGCCDVSEIIGNIHDNPELMGGTKNVNHP